MDNLIIVGLTGPFGSGCTEIAHTFFEKKGYKYLSLSEILRSEYKNKKRISRTKMQDFGNELREKCGSDILAKKAYNIITKSSSNKWVIDSIRNTHEIDFFKKTSGSFYVVAAWADKDVRWNRVKGKYNENRANFDADDTRDNREINETGQQVSLCYQMADFIIKNNSDTISYGTDAYKELEQAIQRFINIIEKNNPFVPEELETLMSIAYANSMRSSCLQRKVGALIIDDYGNIFSSGYNEVPISDRPCEKLYGGCYRKKIRTEFSDDLTNIINNEKTRGKISDLVKKHFHALDYCRALHAEENAIVNMARLGSCKNLSNATLYTTTYPCNLCANKIAQVGIRRIVYFEPYPQEEAKKTLQKHNVEQIPFEGVTYNAYFRFMEVLR